MDGNSERIQRVMKRAEIVKRQREDKTISRLKFTTAVFACLLVCCIGAFSEHYTSGTVTEHCAAILLVDGMGGYVLTAVLTFIAATIITVICIKKHK